MLRLVAHHRRAQAGRNAGQSQSGASAKREMGLEEIGPGPGGITRPPDLSLPVAEPFDRNVPSGLGHRYSLHPITAWLDVCGGSARLVFPLCGKPGNWIRRARSISCWLRSGVLWRSPSQASSRAERRSHVTRGQSPYFPRVAQRGIFCRSHASPESPSSKKPRWYTPRRRSFRHQARREL